MMLRGIRPEVIAALTRVPEVKKQVRSVAVEIRTGARQRAKRQTGALRRSIKVDNVLESGSGQVVYRVGWDKRIASYGGLVERGTHDTPAAAHLVPAALAVQRPGVRVVVHNT
jgi:HK97 gp10 family phage protein